MKWKLLNKEIVFKNKWRILERWKMKTPGGSMKDFFIDKRDSVAIVLGITNDKKVIVIKQYYVAQRKKYFSLVAGFMEKGEGGISTARRELKEETGYYAKKIVPLGVSIKGKYSLGSIYYFLALDAKKISDQHLEAGEDISVHLLSMDKFKKILQLSKFEDTFTEVCAYRALNYLGEI